LKHLKTYKLFELGFFPDLDNLVYNYNIYLHSIQYQPLVYMLLIRNLLLNRNYLNLLMENLTPKNKLRITEHDIEEKLNNLKIIKGTEISVPRAIKFNTNCLSRF
jgi:hypothetical protein